MLARRATLVVLTALSMGLFGSRDALADQPKIEAFPADGSVLERTPERVVLRFYTPIESRRARLSLAGPTGSSSLVIEGSGGPPVRELSMQVPNQGAGKYVVRWELTAADGDRMRGMMQFAVRQ